MRPPFALFVALQLQAASLSYRIETVAGSDYVGDNGPATSAILFQSDGIAADGAGSLYVSDAADNRIRKISRAGVITTYAGTGVPGYSGDGGAAVSAQLNSPYGLTMDGLGNLYVADLGNGRVRKISPAGTITTVAGGGSIPAAGNNGTAATLLSLNAPRNVAWDKRGSIYISDFTAHRVYRLTPDGSLVTAAGSGTQGFGGDGAAAVDAQLAFPAAVAADADGNVYIGDTQNHLIRKVSNGVITSIGRAGAPTGMAIDSFGSLYVADPSGGQLLTFPLNGAPGALPIVARDLCFAPDGYAYSTDGSFVRRISFTGSSVLVAGGGSLAYGDGGPAISARLNHPSGVSAGSAGSLYVADRDNNRIRKVAADGTIATFAGTGDTGDAPDGILATLGALNAPSAVASDSSGNVYIADAGNQRVRVVLANGSMRRIAIAGMVAPSYILAGDSNDLYISDSAAGTILHFTSAGTTVVASNLKNPQGLALDANGDLYVAETDARHVKRIGPAGDVALIGEGVWNIPRGVAVDAGGTIFVADSGRQQVVQIDATGLVTPIAGTGASGYSGDGGDAAAAQLGLPWDVAIGPGGAILIVDLANNRIRRLSPAPAGILAPTPLITAVNAASLQPGPVAPGMQLALLGTGITAPDAAAVLFNGISGTILAADTTRLLVRVPPELAGQSARIQVLNNHSLLGEISAAIAIAAPALFANPGGQLIAINQDGTPNSAANPASRGSIITFFGTGEGVTGAPVSVSIGNYPAEAVYAGQVAGYPGLLQINARIPSGYVPPGNLSVAISIAGASSQPGLAIAVN